MKYSTSNIFREDKSVNPKRKRNTRRRLRRRVLQSYGASRIYYRKVLYITIYISLYVNIHGHIGFGWGADWGTTIDDVGWGCRWGRADADGCYLRIYNNNN